MDAKEAFAALEELLGKKIMGPPVAECQHVFDGPNAEEPETGLVTRTCSKCGKWQK